MRKGIILLIVLFSCLSINSQYIDVTTFGARPDITNNDDTEAIQKAVDAITVFNAGDQIRTFNTKAKTLFFPAGYYTITKPIIINHPIEIIGAGINSTVIEPYSSHGFIINSGGVTIKDMFILGSRKAGDQKNYTGIIGYGKQNTFKDDKEINNSLRDLHFESLKIMGVYFGIELKYVWQSVLDKVKILIHEDHSVRVNQGIRIYGKCVNNKITNCHIATDIANGSNSMGIAIILAKDENLGRVRAEGLMISNSFIAGGEYGIYSEGILSMNVSNCTIDLIKRSAIEGTLTNGLLLSNNWIAVIQKNPQVHPMISLINSGSAHISNNNMQFTDNDNIITDKNGKIIANKNIVIRNNAGISFSEATKYCTVIGNSFVNIPDNQMVLSRNASGHMVVNADQDNNVSLNVNVK